MYSWGVRALDELTGGILPTLTCIYGPTASGKTTLASYVPICRIFSKYKEEGLTENHVFIMIDGDGGWDIERAYEVWQNNGLDPNEVYRHVKFWEVAEFDEQHKLVQKLPKEIENNNWRPLLITFDPMVAIYRGIILRTPIERRATVIGTYTGKLDLQLAILRRLGVLYKCPVLVTSWVQLPIGKSMRESQIRNLMKRYNLTREQAEKIVPAPESDIIGGRQFRYLPKLILRLSVPDETKPEREATLVKHRGRPAGGIARFKLADSGITE